MPILVHGYRFPLGPDAPVYLWWTRLAGAEGLSAAERPGAVALLALSRATGLGLPAAVTGVECAMGVAVGLGAVAVVRAGGGSRLECALAGSLAGTFATHLVAGYVSNLVFAVVFIAALVVLAEGSRRSAFAAAVLLGAGGLAHPPFFWVGVAILLLAAAMERGTEPARAARAAASALGSAAILGAGWVLLLAGPSPLRVDTSQDAFLRRAGLGDTLAHAYRDRLIHRWTRYVQWASVPLALLGTRTFDGWIRRTLIAWLAVTVAGVLVGVVTAWFPPDRFITFGYAIPILAAGGVTALVRRWARRRRVAIAVASGLTLAMVAGGGIAWWREKPYIGQPAVAAVTLASRYASRTPAGTPWLFPVDSPSDRISFLATRLGNVIRAVVPTDRIADVHVVVPPPPPGLDPGLEREWSDLARIYAADAARATRGHPDAVVVRVGAFDGRGDSRTPECRPPACAPLAGPLSPVGGGVSVSAGVATRPAPAPAPTALETSTSRIALAGPLVLVALGVIGFGWSSLVISDRIRAAALAPAFGTAASVLGGVLADRAGVRLSGALPGSIVVAIVAAGGYVALVLSERRRRADPAP